ncbi:MAG: histidine phosphatase family protein [Desulfobacterales bacterium]|jgi:probable phosphoglycerate mutase
MSLTIYFLRHGETTASRIGGYCGTLDPDLTPEGYQMAEDFADAYKSLPWVAVFSSPLRRALATVEPLCKAAGIQVQRKEGLREISYGQWEGKTPEVVNREFHDTYVRWLTDPGWNAPTGGERGIDIARRSSLVIEEIEKTYTTGNVLVVSHKATIRIMLCSLLGIDVGRFRDRIAMPVGSISIVEMAVQGPLLHKMGDRTYLRDLLRSRGGT